MGLRVVSPKFVEIRWPELAGWCLTSPPMFPLKTSYVWTLLILWRGCNGQGMVFSQRCLVCGVGWLVWRLLVLQGRGMNQYVFLDDHRWELTFWSRVVFCFVLNIHPQGWLFKQLASRLWEVFLAVLQQRCQVKRCFKRRKVNQHEQWPRVFLDLLHIGDYASLLNGDVNKPL